MNNIDNEFGMDFQMEITEMNGYSSRDNGDEVGGFSGFSGYDEMMREADKIKVDKLKTKKDIVVYDKLAPVFISQHLKDLTDDVMNKARTWNEVQKELEQERGKPFGNSEAEKIEQRAARDKGDTKNKGYILNKFSPSRGNYTGDVYLKYLPALDGFIGATKEVIHRIRKFEAESKHNFEVWDVLYKLIYRFQLVEYEVNGEKVRHYNRAGYGFGKVKIKKDDIFNELGWDKNNRWDRMKVQNAIYFLSSTNFLIFLKKGMINLAPFLDNLAEFGDDYIYFRVNNLYFPCEHIERKILELDNKGQKMLPFKYLPKFLPELPAFKDETTEAKVMKYFIKGRLIELGLDKMKKEQRDLHFPVPELLNRVMNIPKDKDLWDRSFKKLTSVLDEIKTQGFIRDYSPRIDKGYGRMKKTIKITF